MPLLKGGQVNNQGADILKIVIRRMPRGSKDGDYSLFSKLNPERHHPQRNLSGNKGAEWHHLPQSTLTINTEPL